MTTFLASTFLHGFNFQLGSVLLSLGFFTFIEHKIRSKLANIFNASIEARRRLTSAADNYRYKEASFPVLLANSAFGILTIVHLIYLGVMFDQTELQTEGYKWTHTIDKWKSLDFFSHISMTSAFVLSFLL